MTVTAGTLSSNTGTGGAGGTGNSGPSASGTGSGGLTDGGTSTVRNTISAGNTGNGGGKDVDGTFASGGYNLVGTATDSTGFTATGDQTGTDASPINAQLGTLQNNGGATDTMALLLNSPALDKGKSFGLTTDQRGVARPIDDPSIANSSGGDGSDIGAFELDPSQVGAALIVTTAVDHTDGVCGLADCTLREAIAAANSLAGDNSITFAPAVTGIIQLTTALPNLSTNISVQGPGANLLTVHNNNNGPYRIFTISNGMTSWPDRQYQWFDDL